MTHQKQSTGFALRDKNSQEYVTHYSLHEGWRFGTSLDALTYPAWRDAAAERSTMRLSGYESIEIVRCTVTTCVDMNDVAEPG